MILSCSKVNKAFGAETVLQSVSFNLEERGKAAIVGVNGAGKTTLFKLITGGLTPDGGDIYIKKGASIGYLEQNAELESGRSIYDEMLTVFSHVIEAEERLRAMETGMADKSGAELELFMGKYSAASHDFEAMDGYGYRSRLKGVLRGLGFSEEEFSRPVAELSGGEKTRVFLARLLLTMPDILLLDEPTNHLDIEAIGWLEDFIKSYPKAVLVISHDRYFMDATVSSIIELENGRSKTYGGSYSVYARQKETDREIETRQYISRLKEIKRQEEVIKTLRSFNREKSIKRAESRQKALDKMEPAVKPESLPDKMRLTLTPRITSGNDVLKASGLCKGFGERRLFSGVDIDIKRGERAALIGANGTGKSTLFKMLLGSVQADGGTMDFGANVNIGYYDQEQQTLSNEKTIIQEISDAYPDMKEGEIRNVLAAFVFTGDDVYKQIGSLSGGERGRVSLAKIMLSKANFLMLDEPTNHLDMFSKEILEDALNSYEGTVFYISHDRYFINKTATKTLELTPDGLNLYLGNYTYYMEKKREKEILAAEAAKEAPVEAAGDEGEPASKQEWLKRKEEQAAKKRSENRIKKLESGIEAAEADIKRLDEMLFDTSLASDSVRLRELYEEKSICEQRLAELMEEWENALLQADTI